MSHISVRPLSGDESELLESLLNLSISGLNQGIAKTSATTFENVTFGGGGGGGVTSVNSITGTVTITAGTGISISSVGQTITISSTADLSVTLADVSANSLTTPNSLYTMTSGVPVEFKRSGGSVVLHVDETNGFVGVGSGTGASTPTRDLIVSSATNGGIIQVQNSASGYTATDGFQFAINGSNNAGLWLYETGYMYFATSGVERWHIESTGHITAFADNTYDIGGSGATRPRTIYVGTQVQSPSFFVSSISYMSMGSVNAPILVLGAAQVELYPQASGRFNIYNGNESSSVGVDVTTDGTLFIKTGGNADTAIVKANQFTSTSLTAGRVTFAGTGGLLSDDADMTFATDTLTVTKIIGSTNITTPVVLNTNNAVTASSNAATVPVTSAVTTVTNDSAATLTITITTTNAINRQKLMVCILDFSAVAQTITWVNTENSTVSAPTTSNGSTTLPLTVAFMYNSATSKWRCVGSA